MNKKVAFCTIASANYLSRVQVLEKSLLEYNPGAELHVLLCEMPSVCREISKKTRSPFFSPEDVGCDDWLHMAFYYEITEYNTALKPFFLEKLIRLGYEAIIYFDPDIEIFSSLDPIVNLIPEYDVVLTPHACKPVPNDKKIQTMDAYIRAGQFNLGFIGISGSEETAMLMRWWQDVCREQCILDSNHRFFVDQFWAAIFPSFIDKAFILRDTACNVAYWNIFQRDLKYKERRWLVDGKELKFFHFSGISKGDITKVSVHQNRVSAPKGSDLYMLLKHYYDRIKEQEWSSYDNYRYSFGSYTNGKPVPDLDRKRFLYMNSIERKTIPNPFEQPDLIKKIITASHDSIPAPDRSFLMSQFKEVMREKGFFTAVRYSVRYVLRALGM